MHTYRHTDIHTYRHTCGNRDRHVDIQKGHHKRERNRLWDMTEKIKINGYINIRVE